MCAHLLDQGWKEPRCVDACPTGALTFGEEEELKDLIAKAEVLKPEAHAKPRVYYLNLPNKYFIAGAVYDPGEDEVLEGATVTLTNLATKQTATLRTDLFGDFWFERQEPGTYALKIDKEGYAPATIDSVNASKDINVGDIELHQA
jgi:tetrathionate reductase subunit B